ncbi:MAG: hypothetical protein QG664_688 [Patescibacteria group bacterium]|nr:hypothetical protein [Patescibacteria group bacterium]
MSIFDVAKVLGRRVVSIVMTGVMVALFALGTLILVQPKYSSSMDFLLVQANTNGQDFYSAFKSAEYLGKVLSQAIYSERFITAVIESGKMDDRFLPANKKERLDEWANIITVRNNLELGIISVSVDGQSDRDAARIMSGVAEVLTQKNALFRSGDEKSVEVRVLSGPILEVQPTFQKLLLVAFSGFLSGLFLMSSVVILRHQQYRA